MGTPGILMLGAMNIRLREQPPIMFFKRLNERIFRENLSQGSWSARVRMLSQKNILARYALTTDSDALGLTVPTTRESALYDLRICLPGNAHTILHDTAFSPIPKTTRHIQYSFASLHRAH